MERVLSFKNGGRRGEERRAIRKIRHGDRAPKRNSLPTPIWGHSSLPALASTDFNTLFKPFRLEVRDEGVDDGTEPAVQNGIELMQCEANAVVA